MGMNSTADLTSLRDPYYLPPRQGGSSCKTQEKIEKDDYERNLSPL